MRQDLRRRKVIATRRRAASQLRDCGGLVLLRLWHPGSAADERTAAQSSSRPKSRFTGPRQAPGWSPAKFRLRAAGTGAEDRQLGVWQRRVRAPAGARAAVPACPWPARGASWIRDRGARTVSCAGTDRPQRRRSRGPGTRGEWRRSRGPRKLVARASAAPPSTSLMPISWTRLVKSSPKIRSRSRRR